MKIKIITSDVSAEDLEQKVNEFLYDGIIIQSQSIQITPMLDRYEHDGNICNQWVNYTIIIVYKA